jgi:flagellin
MGLTVNSNISALNAQRHLGKITGKLGKSIERLSSGLRINKASDDAAGIAIASKLGSQVRGLNQAVRNANNAIALTQTAEGGINTVTNILQRVRELAVQAASDDNTSSDRANLALEAEGLVSELSRMVNTTEFNTSKLLDGSFSSKYFQVGANYSQKVTFTIGDVRGKSLGGRAETTGDIADGVTAALDENLGTGEVKINGYDVSATDSSDDQYSVLSIASAQITDTASTVISVAVSLAFTINGTTANIQLAGSTAYTGAEVAASIVAAINDASITNVTARLHDTAGYIIEAKNGENILATFSHTTTASAAGADLFSVGGVKVGLADVSAMFGSATTSSNYNGESSAIAKAAAVNSITTSTGVTATAQSQAVTGASAVGAGTLSAGDIYINGVDIGALTMTASDGTGTLTQAINNQTTSTGVSASINSTGVLVLTAADGRNITVSGKDSTQLGFLSLSGTAVNNVHVYRGGVQLNDDQAFTITSATSNVDLTGTASTSESVSSGVGTYNVASLTIDTQANAEAALLTIDAALDDVNGVRAAIGAVQNRLEFTVSNLEIASENTASSQARIMDADFAVETATFTRNQIMVQAATAMLAQANTLPQAALQLLG